MAGVHQNMENPMSNKKYDDEFLRALAESLVKHKCKDGKVERKAVIAEMAKSHPESPLSPGTLAGIYRGYAGGGIGEFLEKYRRRVSREGQIIAQAMLDWDPEHAAFASAYALAAKRLNEALGGRYRASEIEAMVRRAGGLFELLCDCGVGGGAAKTAVARAKLPRK